MPTLSNLADKLKPYFDLNNPDSMKNFTIINDNSKAVPLNKWKKSKEIGLRIRGYSKEAATEKIYSELLKNLKQESISQFREHYNKPTILKVAEHNNEYKVSGYTPIIERRIAAKPTRSLFKAFITNVKSLWSSEASLENKEFKADLELYNKQTAQAEHFQKKNRKINEANYNAYNKVSEIKNNSKDYAAQVVMNYEKIKNDPSAKVDLNVDTSKINKSLIPLIDGSTESYMGPTNLMLKFDKIMDARSVALQGLEDAEKDKDAVSDVLADYLSSIDYALRFDAYEDDGPEVNNSHIKTSDQIKQTPTFKEIMTNLPENLEELVANGELANAFTTKKLSWAEPKAEVKLEDKTKADKQHSSILERTEKANTKEEMLNIVAEVLVGADAIKNHETLTPEQKAQKIQTIKLQSPVFQAAVKDKDLDQLKSMVTEQRVTKEFAAKTTPSSTNPTTNKAVAKAATKETSNSLGV